MPDWGKYHYGPDMAFDGNRETAWVEGKSDSGIGEFIELSLNRAMTIDTIAVMPGFFVARYFKTNNRVKRLKVRAENSRKEYCEGQCFFVKVTPDANGHVKTIMTSYDHRASTGVITRTYTFDDNGLLSKMSVESQVAHYKPVKIERVSPDQLVLTEAFTYFQGGAGAEVTVKHSIQHNEAYEIIDYKSDVKTRNIGRGQ